MREKEVLHLVPKPQRAALTGGVCRADASVTKERRTLPDGAESYVLEILPEEIRMTGEEAGLFYAERTLEQLRVQFPGEIPCLRIEDAPRFPHRGFMLDSARHFLPEPDVMTLIDAASYFKLNRFHWHLVDDQGWRIESERYPRLHGTGSVRSGSDFGIEEPPQKNASGGAEYRGCYTKAQIRRIVRFAAERNVEIIPEIEIPGHETAAIAAYPELGCTGQAVPVETRPGIFAELICVGREECFTFLTEVLTEILELFPGKLVHIGGDEAVKTHWRACPYCQARIRELGLADENALQQWAVKRIGAWLQAHGRQAVVWNESLRGGALPPEGFVVQSWMGDRGAVADFAERGGQIINSDTASYYFDYPYSTFDAWDVLCHNPVPEYLTEGQACRLLGLEGLLWTERVPDLDAAVRMLYPRLPAMAEAAWTPESARDNDSFFARFEGCSVLFAGRRLRGMAPKSWWRMDEETREADRREHEKLMKSPVMLACAAREKALLDAERAAERRGGANCEEP